MRVLTVTPNPCIDRTVLYDSVKPQCMNKGKGSDEIAGGKGNNVSRVLKGLGHDVVSLNLLGGYTGRRILELLEGDGVGPVAVWMEGRLSRIITTIRDGSPLDGTELADPDPEPGPDDVGRFVDTAVGLSAGMDMVVLAGSSPGTLGQCIHGRIMEGLASSGIPVFLDTNGEALRLAMGNSPHYCKPNTEEMEYLSLVGEGGGVGYPRAPSAEGILQEPRLFLRALAGMGVRNPIISLGAEGCVAMEGAGERVFRCKPPVVDAVNPVGSGDSFVAGFLHGLSVGGGDMGTALRWGTAAGTANALQARAGSVALCDILPLLEGVSVEVIG